MTKAKDYIWPKAKVLYVVYDVEDPDLLQAYWKLDEASDGIEIGESDVIAVYEIVGLAEVEVGRKVTIKRIEKGRKK